MVDMLPNVQPAKPTKGSTASMLTLAANKRS